ncbi:aminoglycoside 6-adenylyltransferase [Butyrivibrio sp. AD3002]|uniref:aminoglycoside 6-adenylyltransferase n=1 Tax=Butyrivibrio sp. AD3002 TaxID=1280670 RepID=UPI0003B771C2|nr:aminoglycoside 6-adenylyltransferase [Butyrivibrio sp. AD3002]
MPLCGITETSSDAESVVVVHPEMFDNTKAHLMVLADGITLVINAMDKETFIRRFNRENEYENVWIGDTYQKILDKDNILPAIERLKETKTIFQGIPTEDEFVNTCNEFWWVMKTFAEYTLRKEKVKRCILLMRKAFYPEKMDTLG